MNIKRTLFILLVLCSTVAFAQERKIKEEGKTIFNPHWFLELQGGGGHTIGEAKFMDLTSPAAALNIGYKFAPAFGFRVGASGWEAKGGWVTPSQTYKFNFVQGNIDLVADLTTLFFGFNPSRVFNAYLFGGGAYNYAFNNDEANALKTNMYELEYLWKDNKSFFGGRFGLGFEFRLSDRVGLMIEGNATTLSDKFNSKRADNADWQINALIGLNIKLGKTYTKTEPVYYEPEPVIVQEAKPEPIVEPVVEEVKEEVVVIEPMTQNIFFTIDSYAITDAHRSNLNELIDYLKKYDQAKVNVTGYADEATGNSNYNLNLSQKRAQVVVDALVAGGISLDRINMDYKGDSVQPFNTPEENRVTICVTE